MVDVTELKGRRIEDEIAIGAPATRVWQVLSDLAGWSRWNPLNTAASGRLAPGETLDITVALPGMKPQPARPEIVAVEPDRGFRYATHGAGGLMRAQRYFIIEPRSAGQCVFRNGEAFAGPVGRLIAALMGKKIRDGMAGMNAALKAECERAG